MTSWRGPRSLSGQIALLVAVALFVAQAINFGLLLRERRQARVAGTSGAIVTRLLDASERIAAGRPLPARGRLRVTRSAAAPLPATPEPIAAIEDAVSAGLADANLTVRQIRSTLRRIDPADPRLEDMPKDQAERMRRVGTELAVAVQRPGGDWLLVTTGYPRGERGLVAQLFAQTLVLYGVVLLAVLWIGRRIARPLRRLADAARDFRPGEPLIPVGESGPGDVRALIGAYNAMGARVAAMLAEKDRMLGAIGHDLRTPLAALRVRIESVDDDQDRERMADIIAEMATTLEDILSLARLGRPSEPPVEVDLAALVDAVVEDFRDLGHDIDADDPVRLPAMMRPTLMRRAVRNLIENAVKYAGAAEVRVVAGADTARIVVRDRGPGIPEAQLAAMFDPFVRGEASRNRETGGTGLGLALAKAIVEQAGGAITLANRPGGGLSAEIAVPIRKRNEAGNLRAVSAV